jgi:hypothetical protein
MLDCAKAEAARRFADKPIDELSMKRWEWAMGVVVSRAFAFRSQWVLIPAADQFDHSATPDVWLTLQMLDDTRLL